MTEWQPVYALINSREVDDILDRADAIHAKDDQDTAALNEQAGEFALAIKKANGLCPCAHSRLGVCLMQLGFTDRAKQEFMRALALYKYDTIARSCLLGCAIDELGLPRGLPSNTGSVVADLTFLAVGGLAARAKLAKLSQMIDELVAAVPHDVSGTDNVDYWLGTSLIMLTVHDTIQSIKLLGGKDRIARAVLGLPWANLEPTPEKQSEIDEVIHKAERRIALTT